MTLAPDKVTELIQHLRRGAVRVSDWSRAADMLEAMQALVKAATRDRDNALAISRGQASRAKIAEDVLDAARLAEAEAILAMWRDENPNGPYFRDLIAARIAALKTAAAGEGS